MNPNARKRLNAIPPCDACPDTRNPGEPRTRKDRKADNNRLFTPKNTTKESDNMTRINHDEFTTYTSPAGRIRVAHSRLVAPRQCMPDGFTISITRKRAAQLLRTMRQSGNTTSSTPRKANTMPKSPKSTLGRTSKQHTARKESGLDKAHAALVRKAKRNLGLSDNTVLPANASREAVKEAVTPSDNKPPTTSLGSPMATKLWESYMLTARKLTWDQYMARWLSDNTG